jgi:hypothetical protein
MTRSDFLNNLQIASSRCVEWTRTLVVNKLPDRFLYLVFPNQSYDGNPLAKGEIVFPGEALRPGMPPPRDATEVVDYLWRDGKVPEWIDVYVRRAAADFTFFKLECCGRFTANDDLLYYRDTDFPPFGVKGTGVPSGWKSVEQDGRFDLDWREK